MVGGTAGLVVGLVVGRMAARSPHQKEEAPVAELAALIVGWAGFAQWCVLQWEEAPGEQTWSLAGESLGEAHGGEAPLLEFPAVS